MTSQASMWKLGEVCSNAKDNKFLRMEPLFWQSEASLEIPWEPRAFSEGQRPSVSFATDERARLFWERAETDLVEQLAAASERVFDAKLTPEAVRQRLLPSVGLCSTLLCTARSCAQHASLQSTLLCRACSFAGHAPVHSTLLCRARFFAEHAPLQGTLLVRARSCAEHTSLQSTLLVRARFFAQHAPVHSTLLCRARFFAEHAPGQSTLLVRARSCAQHASLHSTLLCRACSFAGHAPVQSTLLCRARSPADMLPGCEGGRGASQLWSWVCSSSVLF